MSVVSTLPGRVVGLSLLIAAGACGGGEVAAGEDGPSGFVRAERPQEGAGASTGRMAEEPEPPAVAAEPEPAAAPAPEPEAVASPASSGPSTRAAERAAREQRGLAQLEAGEAVAAARVFSDLLLEEVQGPEPALQAPSDAA